MKFLLIGLLLVTPSLGLTAGSAQDVGPAAPEEPARESHLARARGLAPGEARARMLVLALDEVEGDALQDCLVLAFEEFRNQTRAFRMDLALPLAEKMHARAQADWSAMSLALASTRVGDSARARSILEAQLAVSPEGQARFTILERLGLALLGAGEETLARRQLGGAFAEGSSNAGVVLADMALRAGRPEAARALFRALLDEEPAQSWAHRGWGLSMLPRATGSLGPQ